MCAARFGRFVIRRYVVGLLGRIGGPAIWAPDAKELAAFYAAALGCEVGEGYADESGEPVAVPVRAGAMTCFFVTARSFRRPDWPREELPFHLDLVFDDIPATVERLLGLGATKPDFQPGGDRWTVLLDPSGQPFCISRPH
ncbi:hypothetical protein J116_027355 [Streptomyces thermolilacinus SPC6]|uniref:VOC domain-containing protein n=1 Tax=Streptomyces thermolilacinus SPC6 TaxID=1306406 RepID=A0A1D3DZ61_9ACTN|nr:hypothetical protein J116_027355 [Streptomyces thermolilacinus SPC6]